MALIHQDSSDPTGVRDDTPRGNSEVARARNRKANAAIQLRIAGADWDEIAQVLGFPTPRHAKVAVELALEKELQTGESRSALRQMASKRLDRMLRAVYTKAIDEKNPEQLAAVDRVIKIIDRHARLEGLDAPTEHVVHTPTQTELEQWVATVVSQQAPALEESDIFDGEVVEDEEEQ